MAGYQMSDTTYNFIQITSVVLFCFNFALMVWNSSVVMVRVNVVDIELWCCLFVIIFIHGGKFTIFNLNKNILVNYHWVCLVIDELLALTLFMNLTSTIFQLIILKVDCKAYLVYTYNKGFMNCIMHSMTIITIYYINKLKKKLPDNNYRIPDSYRIVNI